MTYAQTSVNPVSGGSPRSHFRQLVSTLGVIILASLAVGGCDGAGNSKQGSHRVEDPPASVPSEGSLDVSVPSGQALGTPAPGEVTIVAMPDIQWYSLTSKTISDDREDGRLAEFLAHFEYGAEGPSVLRDIHDWIVSHAEEQRIIFVSYLGDIVERGADSESRPRWELARESLDQIHGSVPYGIALGNHDMVTGTGDTRLFQEFFGQDRFAGFDWYYDSFENNVSSAQRIQLPGGEALLFLHLTCNAPDDVLDWAGRVLAEHPDDHVFISTHMLLGPVGRHGGPVPAGMPLGLMGWTKCYGERGNSAQEIWTRFLARHPQIRAVLSGDQSYSQALHEIREGEGGNPVLLMMSDYKQISRDGYLRIVRYKPETGGIRVITWSPVLESTLESTGIVPDPAMHRFGFSPEGIPARR